MPIVVIEAAAPVGSWRPPEALTYHRTLPLPPYTTQVGMLGAALGLNLAETYRVVAAKGLRFGVGGWYHGKARDLWKHQKLQGEAHVGDILLRELLVDVRLAFVVECPDQPTAEEVAAAYQAPAYPLVLGASDAIMLSMTVRIEDMPSCPSQRVLC